ncbi:hypothetical protein AB1Y20_023580 [Prymnesium parvum]|uniref:Uncharacterized protein n=1 Tax=Prymnesium parvum TaxID=97485 RepID=A0AB34JFV2_PRYPA
MQREATHVEAREASELRELLEKISQSRGTGKGAAPCEEDLCNNWAVLVGIFDAQAMVVEVEVEPAGNVERKREDPTF